MDSVVDRRVGLEINKMSTYVYKVNLSAPASGIRHRALAIDVPGGPRRSCGPCPCLIGTGSSALIGVRLECGLKMQLQSAWRGRFRLPDSSVSISR